MEKKYKHRKTLASVILVKDYINGISYYTVTNLPELGKLPTWVVEDSNDWELIEELEPKVVFTTKDLVKIYYEDTYVYFVGWAGEVCNDTYKNRHKYNFAAIYYLGSEADKDAETRKPKVILTTEDGVDITNPDARLYGVDDDFTKHAGIRPRMYADNHYRPMKLFSSEAKRDEYILYNKPLLTMQEVRNKQTAIHSQCSFSSVNKATIDREFNKLLDIAKSKL